MAESRSCGLPDCVFVREQLERYVKAYNKISVDFVELSRHHRRCDQDHTIQTGESEEGKRSWRSWFCDQCPKYCLDISNLQKALQTKTEELESLAFKTNADFRRHQGNSFEDSDVKRLWNYLFVYEAERDIPKGLTHSKKNDLRRISCDLFMEIESSVQKEFIKRMADCLRTAFTRKLSQEVWDAFVCLWQFINIPVEKGLKLYKYDGSLQNQLIERMVECLSTIFSLNEQLSHKINLKDVKNAFSILVTIPNVKEDFGHLTPMLLKKFECKSENMKKFVNSALSLCVQMKTRVPPFVISNSEPRFVPEVHELKPVRGGPDPEENPEIPVSYLRPIVYYNYQGTVLIPGLVVGTPVYHLEESAAVLDDSTNRDDAIADDETDPPSVEEDVSKV